ncbi:ethylene-responsive transcription factor CRF2-like [Lycium barbarum]|uniref:ethylene-responsive transcription factor CRF2-like n=1 Tax=Lycium barbarum TaxID=112863 RepID=UPI00293E64DE|nr:ethylene-responsive transcription factor CRF2-like [Lycium barbarum]
MKSPTKQDFIDENQETKFQRKIKVKISDPYATESSSDDEQEKKTKFIVHEILQEKLKMQPLNYDQFSGKLPPMVRKRKSGKFVTEIKDPFTKKRIWLGTFNTAEEASHVYQSKKLEFEEKMKMAKSVIAKKAISAKSEIGSSSSDPPLMVDSSKVKTRFSLKSEFEEKMKLAKNAEVKKATSAKAGSCSSDLSLMVDSQKSDSFKKRKSLSFDHFSEKLPPMVRKRKSGKFVTEIKDPFTKKRIWLGTFNTAEEASQVYQSKKFEFEEKLKKAKNAKVKKAISAKSELGSSSSDPPLMVDSQNLDSSNEFVEQLEKAKNEKVKEAISAKSDFGSSSSDPALLVNSQTSDSSNGVEEKDGLKSEDELWMGHWVQISEDKEVKFSMKLGVPVDNYGFLLGEFSKLDDLSISV